MSYTVFICSGFLASVGAVTAWLNDIITRYDIVTYHVFENTLNNEKVYTVLVEGVRK